MSGTPKEIVTAFLAAWANGVDSLRQSFVDYLSEDVVYENVDMTYTTTRADALKLIDTFLEGLDHITIDMLAIAEVGDQVLTERIDYLLAKDGTVRATIRVMGIFDVANGRITGWRDYFDPRPFV